MNTLNNCLYELVPLLRVDNSTAISPSLKNQNTVVPSNDSHGLFALSNLDTVKADTVDNKTIVRDCPPDADDCFPAPNEDSSVPDYSKSALQADAERPFLHLFPGLSHSPRDPNHRLRALEPTALSRQLPSDSSAMPSPTHTSAIQSEHFQDYKIIPVSDISDISEDEGSNSDDYLSEGDAMGYLWPSTGGISEDEDSYSDYLSEDEPMEDPAPSISSHDHYPSPYTINNIPGCSTATKSNTKPFTRTSKAENRHYGMGAGLKCSFVENGRLCTAEIFNLPSKMR